MFSSGKVIITWVLLENPIKEDNVSIDLSYNLILFFSFRKEISFLCSPVFNTSHYTKYSHIQDGSKNYSKKRV